jgi:hypothetical protein
VTGRTSESRWPRSRPSSPGTAVSPCYGSSSPGPLTRTSNPHDQLSLSRRRTSGPT